MAAVDSTPECPGALTESAPHQDIPADTLNAKYGWIDSGDKLNEARKIIEFLSRAITRGDDSDIPGPGYSEGLHCIFMDVQARLEIVDHYHDSIRERS
ncbi:hypothetical protein SAMN05192560_0804 [Methylobacillus rhizosphaerae]|uniref:Uncharacterized protein n=1 Tax=Methylobacillus rhizosphaerae TaxID=551994 RepID=A0A238YSD4_9PROT|nr:hypothetical protein SAMN05192560_0804 [Methylobacillus rhizosphaerae]